MLVLETDQPLQRLLQTILRRDGYEPAAARDGTAALRLVSGRPFAAFIIDVSIEASALEPGSRRGIGFLHYLEAQRPDLLKHVVVVTGLAPRDLPDDLPPVAVILRKPFDVKSLRAAVAQCAADQGSLSVSAVPSG